VSQVEALRGAQQLSLRARVWGSFVSIQDVTLNGSQAVLELSVVILVALFGYRLRTVASWGLSHRTGLCLGGD
jgi:hypothetical protein